MRAKLYCHLTRCAVSALVIALAIPGPAAAQGVSRGCKNPATRADIERCFSQGSDASLGIKGDDLDEPATPPTGAPRLHAAGFRRHAAAVAHAVEFSITFATGSSQLTPADIKLLDPLGAYLGDPQKSGERYRIEGHTDTVGTDEVNAALSKARADSVASYLQATYHVDPARLDVVGVGASNLVVQTGPNTPEPRNRVVRVVKLSP